MLRTNSNATSKLFSFLRYLTELSVHRNAEAGGFVQSLILFVLFAK